VGRTRRKLTSVTGLWKPEVARVLGGASVAYLAVETSSGPHVTPLLFAAGRDRLWFGIGRGTLKARVLEKRPAVGAVVPGARASVAIRGEASLLDRLPASPAELARAPFGLSAFASRNALEVAAFARDVARRGARPQPLAPLSVRIDALDLLVGWSAQSVLGWMAPGGADRTPGQVEPANRPSARPGGSTAGCWWPAHRGRLRLHRRERGPGPLAKRGRLLRGQGDATLRGRRRLGRTRARTCNPLEGL
jgi:hypothetical protein